MRCSMIDWSPWTNRAGHSHRWPHGGRSVMITTASACCHHVRRSGTVDCRMHRTSLRPIAVSSSHAGFTAWWRTGQHRTVAVVNDGDVDFLLKKPDPSFVSRLTVGIVPAQAATGRDLGRHPIGSGPFAFVGWRDDGGVLLRRRSDGQQVAMVPVADPTMRTSKLLRGEAHLLQNDLPSELYGYLAGVRSDSGGGPGTFAYIGFNLGDAVLSSRDVRAAIAHAIDRDAIIRYLFGGARAQGRVGSASAALAGASDLLAYRYDPQRARDHLRRAGYDEQHPLTLSYKTSTDPFRLRIAHVLQSQLAAVGIDLKVSSYEWGTFFGDIKRRCSDVQPGLGGREYTRYPALCVSQ